MRLFTLVSVGASAALALGAMFVAKTLAGPGTGDAAADAQPTRAVVVAKTDLQYGEKLSAGKLTLVQMPEGLAPKNAYGRVEDAVGSQGAIVLTTVSANEVLLPAKLSSGARASLAATIAEGHRAYTIRVTDVSGGGGHVLAGDRVDVVLTRDEAAAGDITRKRSDTLVQNVRVLGMDLNADPNATEKSTPKTATLEVTPDDAARLAVAGEVGALSLSLRPVGAAEIPVISTVRVDDLHAPGMRPPAPVAAPRRVIRVQRAPAPARPAPMLIIQGDKRTEVHAPVLGAGA